MVGPREGIVLEFSDYPRDDIGLFNELVNRHDHLREAVYVRVLARQKSANKTTDNASALLRISESVLWFFAVEFYSRYLSDPSKPNHSKRCLLGLIRKVDLRSGASLEEDFNRFKQSQEELLGYLHTQRMKFFAHADEVSWDEFPNLRDGEYSILLDSVADILDSAAEKMGMQRRCSRNWNKVEIFV